MLLGINTEICVQLIKLYHTLKSAFFHYCNNKFDSETNKISVHGLIFKHGPLYKTF